MKLVRVPLAARSKQPIVFNWNILPVDSPVWGRVAAAVPDCNWGLRLDDLVVADCDSPDAATWWAENCPVQTPFVSQGRPGRRAYWYARPPETKLRTFRLRPDLEIRTGSGVQQVIPLSVHPCGAKYEWVTKSLEESSEVPTAPELWLLEQVPAVEVWAEGGGDGWDFIPEGHRDIALTSLAGQLRRHGASMWLIEQALGALNPLCCKPSLPDEDLARIARSVARYAVGSGPSKGDVDVRSLFLEWDDEEATP